jgi:fatty acid desaturase
MCRFRSAIEAADTVTEVSTDAIQTVTQRDCIALLDVTMSLAGLTMSLAVAPSLTEQSALWYRALVSLFLIKRGAALPQLHSAPNDSDEHVPSAYVWRSRRFE